MNDDTQPIDVPVTYTARGKWSCDICGRTGLTAEDNEWTTLWLPLDADQSALQVAIADALVAAFGRFDPDDLEIGSRTWDRGPLGNSVMCRLEVRLRGKS